MLLLLNLVLEDFAVSDVLVLVNDVAHASLGSLAALIVENVKLLGTIRVEGVNEHHGVEASLLHRVDIGVDVQLNLEFVDFTRGFDS